jgi:hypothetical protein
MAFAYRFTSNVMSPQPVAILTERSVVNQAFLVVPACMLSAGVTPTRSAPAIARIAAQDIVIGVLADWSRNAGTPIGDPPHFFRPLRGFDLTEALMPPLVE